MRMPGRYVFRGSLASSDMWSQGQPSRGRKEEQKCERCSRYLSFVGAKVRKKWTGRYRGSAFYFGNNDGMLCWNLMPSTFKPFSSVICFAAAPGRSERIIPALSKEIEI